MSEKRKKFTKGIRIKKENIEAGTGAEDLTLDGEIGVDASDNKVKVRLNGSTEAVVTEDQTQTLTNKTIEDITLDGDISGTAILDEDDLISNSDTKLATQKSIKAYVDSQIQTKDEASEIAYDNTTSGLASTDVQAAVGEIETRVDQNEVDIASNESDIADNAANIATNTANISTNASEIAEIDQNVDDLITLSGQGENSNSLGSFDGNIIANQQSIKGALQDLEDAIEAGDNNKVDRVSPSTDNAIVRFDGINGDQQDSGVTISDTNTVTGITQLSVDNLTLDGDALSNNTSGDVNIQPTSGNEVVLQENTYIKGNQRIEPTSDITSGANVTLPEPISQVIYLTSATLESIDMIPRINSSDIRNYKLTLINVTGNPITINNETGATANDQITTGTGLDLVMEDDTSINLIYNSVNNKWQVIGGTGSGNAGGSGGYNYIENGNAEVDTTGWVVYANTTPDTKPDDFGGTPSGNLTFTQNTTNPLVEEADFKLSKTASNLQGEGVYYQFTAEEGHKTLKNLLKLIADTSALDDGDLTFYLVSSSDSFVADFNIISPNNPDLIAGSPQILKQFQFDASDDDYRLCIHYASTDTDAKDVYFDDIELGPRSTAAG